MKEEILRQLEDAAYWEDDFLLKYENEDVWELIKAVVSKEDYEKIRQLFQRNLDDTRSHKAMIQKIVDDVKGGKHDL